MGCELASRANVKRFCLFHHDPQDNDFALDKLAKRTRDYLHIIVPQSTMNIDICAEGNEFNL